MARHGKLPGVFFFLNPWLQVSLHYSWEHSCAVLVEPGVPETADRDFN